MTTVQHPTHLADRRRRFRLVRGGKVEEVLVAPAPKVVQLSPGSVRWLTALPEALGPSYRVTTEGHETPAAIVIDSRDPDLVELIQGQRRATRIIVVHTGHPSEQPMTPTELLDLGADTYLAPVTLAALAAHIRALTRSWDAFPPRPTVQAG